MIPKRIDYACLQDESVALRIKGQSDMVSCWYVWYVSIRVFKMSICGVYRKGTNNSEAVVCRKFSRRRQERRELASFSYFLFSLIALRMWMRSESRERGWDECLSAGRIFICILRDKTALVIVAAIKVFALKSVWLERRLIAIISLSCHREFLKQLVKRTTKHNWSSLPQF